MRINRMRMGMELMNKLDGGTYKITAINSITGHGTAQEMVIGDGKWTGEFTDKQACITEKNALAFRIVNDPEPYPVPTGYSILDGKLLKDGMPACETGELVFTEILAVQSNFLILAAKTKETKDGMVELMSYQVSRDRFAKLRIVPEGVKLLGYIGENQKKAILGYSSVMESEEDGVTVRFFDQAGIMIITNGVTLNHYSLEVPTVLDDIIIMEVPNSSNGKFELFVPFDELVNEDNSLAPQNYRMWYRVGEYGINGEFTTGLGEKIRADWSYVYKCPVIRTKGMVMVPSQDITIHSPMITELNGYDTLIDITKANYEYCLTFSNEDYCFKTLVSKSTMDRGYIVTIE